MLYLFAGDDVKNKLHSLEKFTASLGKEAEVFFVAKNNFSGDQVESLVSGSGLFAQKFAVVFDNILEKNEVEKFLLARLPAMAQSENHFIFSEGKTLKATLDVFKKSRAELNIFEVPKEKKEKFDNFLLADAFGSRDKLGLWVYFRQAVGKGVGLEELVGVLFWKAKDMMLKKSFTKFSRLELENFSARLSYLLPKARREGLDAEPEFEAFLLETL